MSTSPSVENGSVWEKAKSTFDNDIIDGDKSSRALKYEAVNAFLTIYWGDKDWLTARRKQKPGLG